MDNNFKQLNIYQRLSNITSELTAVAKNLSVGEGKSSYKAVGEADVLAAVKPLENKWGVYSYPASRRVIDSDCITVKKTYNGNESESSKFFMRVETVYRFVNVDNPTDYIDVTTYGDGVDPQDKAPGKAMTYGDKYALLKAYKIITGDDPDQNASDDGKVTRESFARARAKANTCEKCGKPIVDAVGKNGAVWSAADIIAYSEQRFSGRHICAECMKGVKTLE